MGRVLPDLSTSGRQHSRMGASEETSIRCGRRPLVPESESPDGVYHQEGLCALAYRT
jgi:hypothetical protein